MTKETSSRKPTIVIGTGPLAEQIVRAMEDRPRGKYICVGVIADAGTQIPEGEGPPWRMLGTTDDLETAIARCCARCVVVTAGDSRDVIPERLLLVLLRAGVEVRSALGLYEEITGKLLLDWLTPRDYLLDGAMQPSAFALRMNRFASVVLACIGLLASAPLMVVIAIAVKLDSRGPVLFVQKRSGVSGRCFRLLKFRSMRTDTAAVSVWAGEESERITRVGRMLRRFRLDELPQFLNVVRGDMNIVGPRPHPERSSDVVALISRNIAACGDAVPYYTLRARVRPGITGWAQVRYKYANGLCEELEKLRYDLYYVKNYSWRLDLRILWLTVAVIMRGCEADVVTNAGVERSAVRALEPDRQTRMLESEEAQAVSGPHLINTEPTDVPRHWFVAAEKARPPDAGRFHRTGV